MNGSSPRIAWIQCFCGCAIGMNSVPAGSVSVTEPPGPNSCTPSTTVTG